MNCIGIVDYGINNLFSVKGAIEKLGSNAIVTGNPDLLSEVTKLVLPGVGAFGPGMKNLERNGLVEMLNDHVVVQRKPILGICLGAQLMLEESSETPGIKGLGWIQGKNEKLNPKDRLLRTPHVGWNGVSHKSDASLFQNIPNGADFYFVHGYYMLPQNHKVTCAEFSYGSNYCAAIAQDHIFATQFHPEKSQSHGLQLLKNFLEL